MSSDPLARARVLLVGSYPPPFGGIAVHVQTLRERLQALGTTVRVLDVGGRGESREEGVVPVRGPVGLAGQLALHGALGYLVHAQISGHTPKSWLVALAAGLARRPFGPAPVLTLHSGLTPNYLAVGEQRRAFARAVAQRYGRIIAVNPLIERALLEAGVPAQKLVVAPAFIARPTPGRLPVGFEAARRGHRPLLACAVSASPIYGARVLFQALGALSRRVPNAGVVLFGPADAGALRELARKYGVEDRIELLGELEHAQALAVIAACDLFVRPSLADGDALSVREALALGRPVVASACGYRPAGTVLFRTGDALELAQRIEEALPSRPVAPKVPDRGAEVVLETYRQLLGAPGGEGPLALPQPGPALAGQG